MLTFFLIRNGFSIQCHFKLSSTRSLPECILFTDKSMNTINSAKKRSPMTTFETITLLNSQFNLHRNGCNFLRPTVVMKTTRC